jgi:uncharacterized protein YxjI
MNSIFKRNLYFIKEHTGIFKAANNYDILDPNDGTILMECREPALGIFTKLLRFTKYKSLTPFNVVIQDSNSMNLIRLKRGVSFFRSSVEVFDTNEILLGTFKQKFLSIGGKFRIIDPQGNEICTLSGKWHSWDFSFNDMQGNKIADVNKKWAGIGKELFTSADNYMLSISDTVKENDPIRQLIVAAVMCIDMVLKEH